MVEGTLNADGHNYQVEWPEQCPICHHHGEIRGLTTSHIKKRNEVQVVFECAFSGCKSYFIGYYGPPRDNKLLALKPIKPMISVFPEVISNLSPPFISIYAEAEEARQLGLSQIAGPGYRKAFEYLIKDYAKSMVAEEKENIEKAFSGTVVDKYINDPRIQAVAKRTLWLGNDETHYLRKWESHDIEDLINLIKLAVNWIEIGELTKHYCDTMPE